MIMHPDGKARLAREYLFGNNFKMLAPGRAAGGMNSHFFEMTYKVSNVICS